MTEQANITSLWKTFFLVATILLISSQTGLSDAPETIEHALGRYHIPITKSALVEALANPEKEVRGLAAAQLATIKALDTLPDILRAAENEKDPQTQANIAAAATWLDSLQGLNLLKKICLDSSLPSYARQYAARNVFDKGDHTCFDAMIDLMQPEADMNSRIGSAYMLSQLHDRTQEESKLVLHLLLASLNDRDVGIRLAACEALRWLNDPAAIKPLRSALSYEREDAVRQPMQSALDFLARPSAQP
jgi:HEAT repeat protein